MTSEKCHRCQEFYVAGYRAGILDAAGFVERVGAILEEEVHKSQDDEMMLNLTTASRRIVGKIAERLREYAIAKH
jgi:hypothetical protein